MSSRKKQPLPYDAERLFREMAKREAENHECARDLTPEFLRELSFRTVDAVGTAADQVSLYAPEGKRWDGGVCLMHVEDGRLVCGPAVVEAWQEYERGIREGPTNTTLNSCPK